MGAYPDCESRQRALARALAAYGYGHRQDALCHFQPRKGILAAWRMWPMRAAFSWVRKKANLGNLVAGKSGRDRFGEAGLNFESVCSRHCGYGCDHFVSGHGGKLPHKMGRCSFVEDGSVGAVEIIRKWP